MLNRMGIGRPPIASRWLAEPKELSFVIIELGVASRICAFADHARLSFFSLFPARAVLSAEVDPANPAKPSNAGTPLLLHQECARVVRSIYCADQVIYRKPALRGDLRAVGRFSISLAMFKSLNNQPSAVQNS